MSERKVAREWGLYSAYSYDYDGMKWYLTKESEVTPEVEKPEKVKVREVIPEQDRAVAELVSTVQKFAEYFGAIQRGEYDNNRRPAPLRPYEELILDMAEDVLAKFKEQRGLG